MSYIYIFYFYKEFYYKKSFLLLALVLILSLVACSNTNKETGKETCKEVSEGLPFEGKTLTFAGLEGGYGTDGWN